MSKFLDRYGQWALITGASSGIGVGFARALAARGFDLVLVARRDEPMRRLARALEQEHGTATRVIAADLSQPDSAHRVLEAIADLDVGLLVSNAGAGRMGGFLQNEAAQLESMLHLNVLTQMKLTHGFATGLVTHHRRGGILLVSSTSALQPVALGANYASAKAYVLHLGEALNLELAEQGVDVSVLVPGPTKTPGLQARDDVDFSGMPMKAMTVDAVVEQGLAALERRRPAHVAGWLNRWMARLLPRRLARRLWSALMRKATPARLQASHDPADPPIKPRTVATAKPISLTG